MIAYDLDHAWLIIRKPNLTYVNLSHIIGMSVERTPLGRYRVEVRCPDRTTYRMDEFASESEANSSLETLMNTLAGVTESSK